MTDLLCGRLHKQPARVAGGGHRISVDSDREDSYQRHASLKLKEAHRQEKLKIQPTESLIHSATTARNLVG